MQTRIYVLKFLKEITGQPIIYQLVKEFDIKFNILKATIPLQQEGVMVLEIQGQKNNVIDGLNFLKEQGVKVERIAAAIHRDDDKCYQCGVCTGICPTAALNIERPEMNILFEPEKCSGCGLCTAVCPVRAMEVSLNQTINQL
jgi:L-aspartate semialdehyde sulfurtransferase ferredoxin